MVIEQKYFLENAYNIVSNNNILHNLVSIKALVGNNYNSTRTGGLLHCRHEITLLYKPPPKVSQCQLNRDIRHYCWCNNGFCIILTGTRISRALKVLGLEQHVLNNENMLHK